LQQRKLKEKRSVIVATNQKEAIRPKETYFAFGYAIAHVEAVA